MKANTKKELINAIGWVLSWGIFSLLGHYQFNFSWNLACLLAAAFTQLINLKAKVDQNKVLFDLNDAELVRVSALANNLQEKISDMQYELEQLKFKD